MTNDVINVMKRISDINNRFIVKRHNLNDNSTNRSAQNEGTASKPEKTYDEVHNNTLSRLRDNDMSSAVASYTLKAPKPEPVHINRELHRVSEPAGLKNLELLRQKYRDTINATIDFHAARRNVPASLIKSIVEVESGYNPLHISKQGGKGLMGLAPGVLRRFGVNDPFSVDENIRAGTALVQDYLQVNGWDYKKALLNYSQDKPGNDPEQFVKNVFELYAKM